MPIHYNKAALAAIIRLSEGIRDTIRYTPSDA